MVGDKTPVFVLVHPQKSPQLIKSHTHILASGSVSSTHESVISAMVPSIFPKGPLLSKGREQGPRSSERPAHALPLFSASMQRVKGNRSMRPAPFLCPNGRGKCAGFYVLLLEVAQNHQTRWSHTGTVLVRQIFVRGAVLHIRAARQSSLSCHASQTLGPHPPGRF